MKIQFKDFETKQTLTTDLNTGDVVEYENIKYKISRVAEKMCRIIPINEGLAMWISYDRLFNNFPSPVPPPKFN